MRRRPARQGRSAQRDPRGPPGRAPGVEARRGGARRGSGRAGVGGRRAGLRRGGRPRERGAAPPARRGRAGVRVRRD